MRVLDASNESVLFWGRLIKVMLCGDPTQNPAHTFTRVTDENGWNLNHAVRDLVVQQDMKRSWAELELVNTPGFDGRFCTPEINLS